MNLGDRLKRWREIARLRGRAKDDPSPTSIADLAGRLIAFGELEEALRTAEEGLRRFPDSEKLQQFRLFAKKGRLTGQIRQLREDLQRRPSPAVYGQLAQIYRELGSQDEALEIAASCAERFPLNESPHLIQGEIRLERFLRDQVVRDAITAEEALRRVIRLNAHSMRAHLLLAELYHVVGSIASCRAHLRCALSTNPQARDIQEFLTRLGTAASAARGEAEEDFRDLVRRVEETGVFANAPGRVPGATIEGGSSEPRDRAQVDVEALQRCVAGLGGNDGVRNTVVLGRDGAVLADGSAPEGALSRRQFADLVRSVAATADDASRRMDTGSLVRAEIEGPSGNVTVARMRHFTIGVLFADPLRPERVWEMLEDLVARNVGTTREAAHA